MNAKEKKAKKLFEKEIEDMEQRIQTHVDSKKREYGFDWGSIGFYFHEDKSISVFEESVGEFRFLTSSAVAEFVLCNLIPIASQKLNKN